jgi:formate dehydrogenase subunit beta
MNQPTQMASICQAIREQAARLLSDQVVDVVIGFEAGTLALKTQPAFITRPEEAKRLIHSGFNQNSLASYVTRRPQQERIGIVCRGCESRAIRVLVSEHQHDRENLYLIGVPCTGIIDWRKIQHHEGLEPEQFAHVSEAIEEGDEVIVRLDGQELRFRKADVIHDSCQRCADPNPVGADIVLGEALPVRESGEDWSPVLAFGDLTSDERYAYFRQESERCIRCYACREACPMCYCTECFVDHNFPSWLESMTTPGGTQAWHIVRAFHQTGRCASCGACERACPMDIKMTYLTDKLNYDMVQQYDFRAGARDGAQPPFATFTLDDKKRFVR